MAFGEDVISISVTVGDDPTVRTFTGRQAQTLHLLEKSGKAGLSSFESPGVRLSHYVHQLRRAGVDVACHDEKHDGPLRGVHGRYELACSVQVVEMRYAL